MTTKTTIRAALTVAMLVAASAAGAQDRQSADDLQPVPDSAFMSISSVISSPSKPIAPRITCSITTGDSVAGRVSHPS